MSESNFCIFENIKILEKFLKQNDLFEKYKNNYRTYVVDVLVWHYPNIPENMQAQYIEKTEQLLSQKEFSNFQNKINGNFSLLEKIFSIKKLRFLGKTKKCLTILGYTIRL